MADHETVWIEVSERGYHRGGNQYGPGSVLEIPVYAVDAVIRTNPPRGRIIEPVSYHAPGDPDLPPFSDAARRELRQAGFHETAYDGPATGADGKVLKSDVEEWIPGDVEGWLEDRVG